ncbi:MAG: hypothetical protein WD066_05035 [Planctomycetaceae bacterium]
MTIGGIVLQRARHDHDRIAAEIGEHGDAVLGSIEVFGERVAIGTTRQLRAVQEDELEWSGDRFGDDGGRFPPERRVRRIRQNGVEQGPKARILPPRGDDLRERRAARIEVDLEPLPA